MSRAPRRALLGAIALLAVTIAGHGRAFPVWAPGVAFRELGVPSEFLTPALVKFQPRRPSPAALRALQVSNLDFVKRGRSIRPVQVSHAAGINNGRSESHITADPSDPRHLVGSSKFFTNADEYLFHVGTYVSFNAGRTWTAEQVVPGFDDWTITSDPAAAIDDQGRAYICVLAASRDVESCADFHDSALYVSRSDDGGVHWNDPVQLVRDEGGFIFHDKQWMTVDAREGSPFRGTVYVTWTLFGFGSRIMFTKSDDAGETWSEPQLLSTGSFSSNQASQPVVAPNGDLYVMWGNFNVGGQRFAWVRSTDGGETFSAPQVAFSIVPIPGVLPNSIFRTPTFPMFDINDRGTLLLAWQDYRNGDSDVLFSRSADGGATWTAPVRVNDDPVGDGMDQFQPAIAAGPKGQLAIAWYDRRLTGNTWIDTAVAVSKDEGVTWSRNQRLTEVSWDPAVGAATPGGKSCGGFVQFIGDYFGNVAGPHGTFIPLWLSTQTGIQELYAAQVQVPPMRNAAPR